MKILVIHSVPNRRIDYARALDHEQHAVTYIGSQERIDEIPDSLPCKRIVIPCVERRSLEVQGCVSPADGFEMVLALSEFDLHEAGLVREYLGVPGPRYHELLPFKDKILMKDRVRKSALRVPHCLDLRRLERTQLPILAASLPWSGPTVLKPILGASSVGVQVFPTLAASLVYLQEAEDADSYWKDGELEEFVQGPIFHIDGVAEGGQPKFLVASRYIGTPLAYMQGQPLGSVQFAPDDELVEFSVNCLRAVGISDSAFHLELIGSPEGPVFMEVAARVGGGDIIPTTECGAGRHIPSEEIAVLIEKQQRLLKGERQVMRPHAPMDVKRSGPWCGWFVFPGHHFPESSCRVAWSENLMPAGDLVRLRVHPPGSDLKKQVTHQYWEVPLAGIMRGTNPEILQKNISRILSEVQVIPSHHSVSEKESAYELVQKI